MTSNFSTDPPALHWTDANGQPCVGHWRSERRARPPVRIALADDTTSADNAFALVTSGTALLWQGDFQNARQLLQALVRRLERRAGRRKATAEATLHERFLRQRQEQAQRASTLGMLLIPLGNDYAIPLRRAPDVTAACTEVWGEAIPYGNDIVVSLRELQGLIGAHEWRRKGVAIPMLGKGKPGDDRIIPHYGVFSPLRGEYLDLIAGAPLDQWPAPRLAFDIGTGTGVIAAILARRGVERVLATDNDSRALACARENVQHLGLEKRIEVLAADLFPPGEAQLVVCNPPWLPGRPSSGLEHAIYDPESRMLRGFLAGLGKHLAADGEGWLILSDLAEHLGLRQRDDLLAMIAAAGLRVLARIDTRPRHSRAADADDPLHAARAAEITSLWRLTHATPTAGER